MQEAAQTLLKAAQDGSLEAVLQRKTGDQATIFRHVIHKRRSGTRIVWGSQFDMSQTLDVEAHPTGSEDLCAVPHYLLVGGRRMYHQTLFNYQR